MAIKEGTDTMTMRDLIEAIEQRVADEGDLAEMGPPPGPGYRMVFGRWVKSGSATAKIADKYRVKKDAMHAKHKAMRDKKTNNYFARRDRIDQERAAAKKGTTP